jgi:hypothetical protein
MEPHGNRKPAVCFVNFFIKPYDIELRFGNVLKTKCKLFEQAEKEEEKPNTNNN